MSYQNNNQNNAEFQGGNTLWQRQNDVLRAITEAELLIREGERMMLPMFASTFGKKQNYFGVSTILKGCDELVKIITPHLEEKIKEEGKKPVTLKDSETEEYKVYKQALSKAQDLINKSSMMNGAYGDGFLQEAYDILKLLQTELKNKTVEVGFDFKKKPSPYDAWKR